jgi:hypothetical protein
MSNLAIRDLEQNAVLDSAEMQSIKGGALIVNLYDVYNNPWNYTGTLGEGLVKIANDHFNGD